jgi:hypothetical protein
VSLDPTSGICSEVPQVVTGTFLSDYRGNWITNGGFSYTLNSYAANLLALQYTNEQWRTVMTSIASQVSAIGTKGKKRDYAWNMVAWSSYVATYTSQSSGSLTFYSTGKAGVIYDRPVTAIGYGSAASRNNTCTDQYSTYSYNSLTGTITITTDLKRDGYCSSPPCEANPCPGILSPQAMGYDIYLSTTTEMTWKINMQAVTTALAVNMGLRNLSSLQNVVADADRIALFSSMQSSGYLDAATAGNTSTYYGMVLY